MSFRLQAADTLLPTRPGDAKQILVSAIEDGTQAITEARDAVQELRSSSVVTYDLASAITALGAKLAVLHTAPSIGEDSTFLVEVEGTPQDLHPILRDEIYRIAGKALRNAFHAQARRIAVEIQYDQELLRVRIRNDESGIEPSVLSQEGQADHLGLSEMRASAQQIGAQLDFWSERADPVRSWSCASPAPSLTGPMPATLAAPSACFVRRREPSNNRHRLCGPAFCPGSTSGFSGTWQTNVCDLAGHQRGPAKDEQLQGTRIDRIRAAPRRCD